MHRILYDRCPFYCTCLSKEVNGDMETELFDHRLKMKCTVAFGLSGKSFGLLNKYESKIQCHIYKNGSEQHIQLYFPKEKVTSAALFPFITKSVLKDKGSFYVMEISTSKETELIMANELMSLKSVLVEETYIQNGELFLDFLFHSNNIGLISKKLNDITSKSENFRLIFFGYSKGLIYDINELAKSEGIMVVQLSTNIEIYSNFVKAASDEDPNAIFIPDIRIPNRNAFRVLKFSDINLGSSYFKEIGRNSGVYEAYGIDNVLAKIRNYENENKIPRHIALFRRRGDRLIDTTLMPDKLADEYLRTWVKELQNINGAEPEIEYYHKVEPDVWKWL